MVHIPAHKQHIRHRGKPQLIRAGSVTVKLYRTKWHDKKRRRTYRASVVAWCDNAGRHREKHAGHEAAARRATEIANAMANGEISMEQFRQADRASYQRAVELLAGTGKTLELAISEYVSALRELPEPARSQPLALQTAARYYASHHAAPGQLKACPEILADMLRVRKQDGASKNTLDDYRSRLGRFVKDHTGALVSLTTQDLDAWLSKLDVSRRTRNNYRGNLVDFYAFARRQGFIPDDFQPLAKVPKLKNEPVRIEAFTPEEITAILHARQTIEARAARLGRPVRTAIPYLAIAAFAGCRHEELCSPGLPVLDWRQVDLERREIHVLPEVARKIGRDRIVPISDNLAEWLEPFARPNGHICRVSNMNNVFQRAAKAAGIKWKDNGLRRSFISYRLALIKDIGTVALEAGTSPDRIRHNYKKTLPEREAKRWFDIHPSSNGIIQLNFAFR